MSEINVVILNWNGEQHLRTFLPSVVENTPEYAGIYVIDNGSTDNSLQLISTFDRVKVVVNDSNYGFAGGYNKGIDRITGDYLVLLNSDIQTPSGWLDPLVEVIRADSDIAVVAPKILSYREPRRFEYAGASGGFIDKFGYPFCRGRILDTVEEDMGQYDDAREVFWATGACFMVRREIYDQLGGFDESFFAHMEEIDLCWRARSEGYKVMVEPRSCVYHLGGGTLAAESPYKLYLNYRNNLAMMYKNIPSGPGRLRITARMVLDFFSASIYLVTGRLSLVRSVWNAHRDFKKMKPRLSTKRRAMTAFDGGRDPLVYRGSIVLRYFLGKKTFGDIL